MADEEVPNPTLEEFATWLSPSSALDALAHLRRESAARTILNRAEHGHVIAAASSITWKSEGRSKSVEIFSIPKEWWGKVNLEAWDDFWKVGDATVSLTGHRSSTVQYHLFDVRFDPVDIGAISGGLLPRSPIPAVAQIATPLDIKAETPQEARRLALAPDRSVSEGQLTAWAKTYLAARPGLVHDEIAAAAAKHFHPRTVTRRPLRNAIKLANYPVRRGKPPRNRNNPAN
ncbi:MAG TPA: hypothetical protein VNZ85_05725 [Caulobacter sp.]|nr:hypothetical protein [Caulobacter sp.]